MSIKVDRDTVVDQLYNFTDQRILEIIRQYYSGDPIKEMLEELNIQKVSDKDFSKVLPRLIFSNKCPECQGEMRTVLLPKSGMTRTNDVCLNCGYELYVEHDEMNAMMSDEEASKKIKENYSETARGSISYEDLDLKQKTLLATYLYQLPAQTKRFEPLKDSQICAVAPCVDDFYTILKKLYQDGILLISPSSNRDAFVFDKKQVPGHYFPSKVSYVLNVSGADMKDLRFPRIENTEQNKQEFYECWLDINVSMLNQYIEMQTKEIEIFEGLNDTEDIFRRYLKYFSAARMMTLIKESLHECAWELALKRETNFDAMLLKHCQLAVSENRDVTPSDDANVASDSAWFDILFKEVTNIGKNGYLSSPSQDLSFN